MKNSALELIYRAAAAWEMLFDWPLPVAARHRPAHADEDDAALAVWFPLWGALLGLALALWGWFAAAVFNPVAGALLFALAAVLAGELKDSARGLSLFVSAFMLKLYGRPLGESVAEATSDWSRINTPAASGVFALMAVFKLALCFALAWYHAEFWLIGVFAGGFTVQLMLAATPSGAGGAIIDVPRARQGAVWKWCGLFFVLLFFRFYFAAAIGFLLVWLTVRGFRVLLVELCGGVDEEGVTLGGYVAEFVLLITGVCLALKLPPSM